MDADGQLEPTKFAACIMGLDLKLFDMLAEDEDRSWTITEMAERSKADTVLLARLLKHLNATNVIRQTGPDEFRGTPTSKSMIQPGLRGGLNFSYEVLRVSVAGMPSYFKSKGYKSPTSVQQSPFQRALDTEQTFFGWLSERPEKVQEFARYMTGYRTGIRSSFEIYPFEQRVIQNSDPKGETLLVDLGGGIGQDLLVIRNKFGTLPGDLVVEDLPDVISQIPQSRSENKFKTLAHDFFEPQPIKGARAYYFHSVLHDWGDEDCHRILSQVAKVMKPGYSKLLIDEYVVPDIDAPWEITSLDLIMLSIGNPRERTTKEWRKLLSDVGIEIKDIVKGDRESIIEAQLT